jgi:diadenosine tetraphosphate (Ap4A) HIT family hydrolase
MSLDHLWAGWRAAYVGGVASQPIDDRDGSVFTQILTSGRPDDETFIVWRGPTCFAILNAFPYTNGHLLLMPYREAAELVDLTPTEHAELWSAATAAVSAIQAAYRPDGVNLGMNLGRTAGAGVPGHLHIHVLPRWNGDTNFMTTVAGVRVLPETLADSWAKLRAAWP